MKANELARRLENAAKVHGDLDVYVSPKKGVLLPVDVLTNRTDQEGLNIPARSFELLLKETTDVKT